MSTNKFFVRNIVGCYQNSNQSQIFFVSTISSQNIWRNGFWEGHVLTKTGIDVNVFNKILLKL